MNESNIMKDPRVARDKISDEIKDMSAGEILEKMVKSLKSIYGDKLVEIVLYGSYAKGIYEPDSDIDIMVLVDVDESELKKYEKELNRVIADISYESMKVFSVIDMSYHKFIEWVNVVPYYKNVKNEGVILYAA